MGSQAHILTSLSLSFLICKVVIVVVPLSQDNKKMMHIKALNTVPVFSDSSIQLVLRYSNPGYLDSRIWIFPPPWLLQGSLVYSGAGGMRRVQSLKSGYRKTRLSILGNWAMVGISRSFPRTGIWARSSPGFSRSLTEPCSPMAGLGPVLPPEPTHLASLSCTEVTSN